VFAVNQIWLKVFGALLIGGILKYAITDPLAGVAIDLVVLGVCYLILRRFPYIDIKKSMIFLSTLTGVSILVDLGVISGAIGNIVLLVLVVWMLVKGYFNSPQRPKLRHKWHK
jgi:hypothetical protein